MKRLIKRALFFAVIILLVYPISVALWSQFAPLSLRPDYTKGGSNVRFAQAKTVESLDVLFLGSSHTARGFDPRIFEAKGFKVFNLGSDSQTPKNTLSLLNRYLDQLNPKLVIYEVGPFSFVGSGLESAIDLMANDKMTSLSAYKQVSQYRSIKLLNAAIYRASNSIFKANNTMSYQYSLNGDQYIDCGFIENNTCPFELRTSGIGNWSPREDQIVAFKEINELIHNKQIPIMFVTTPNLWENSEWLRSLEGFHKFITDYEPYYDFSDILDIQGPNYFCDPGHLNQKGVEVFNRKLLEVLSDQNHNPRFLK